VVRAWVNHYGAMYAALKALHDLARRWIWSGEASSKCKIEKPEGTGRPGRFPGVTRGLSVPAELLLGPWGRR
jgi:hypothetical protein